MTKKDKLKTRFLTKPRDFTWDELKSLLIGLEFEEFNSGKTSGSRIRFIHSDYSDIVLHKPHPNPELKSYQLKQIIIQLKKEGLL